MIFPAPPDRELPSPHSETDLIQLMGEHGFKCDGEETTLNFLRWRLSRDRVQTAAINGLRLERDHAEAENARLREQLDEARQNIIGIKQSNDALRADAESEHKMFTDLTGCLDRLGIDFETERSIEEDIIAFVAGLRSQLAAAHDWLTHDYPEIPTDLPLVERIKKLDGIIERQEREW